MGIANSHLRSRGANSPGVRWNAMDERGGDVRLLLGAYHGMLDVELLHSLTMDRRWMLPRIIPLKFTLITIIEIRSRNLLCAVRMTSDIPDDHRKCS
jgi:hypothetical protein